MTAPLQPTASPMASGALLLGDYALGTRLDRRASADVYEATHVPTGGARLVYVLHAAAAQDNPLVHQVVCEIDAARWLRHAAIAKVDGHGETPTGAPYVAVARAAGRPLGEALASGALRGRRRFVRLANRLVEALDEAHQVGLVHGRLTPASIVVGDTADELGTPPLTILGFGVAALAHDGPVPPAGRVYVAPEVLAGGTPDERSDVFALASVLHHLLVGAAPGAPGPVAAGTSMPADHASALAVLAGARAADPAHRPRSVKAFWEELMAALVDDAAAPAPAAARTSGETAVRTVLEQLEHERRQAPRADAKATLLSPMPAAADPSAGRPATADASAALAALAALAPSPPPVPAALAPARPSVAVPAADAPAPAAPAFPSPRPSHADGEPRPAAPERPARTERADRVERVERAERIERAERVERAELARAADRDTGLGDLPLSRAIRAGLPARYRARPGFLLAAGIGATVAFLAIVNWPVAIDAAPVVDPDPPAVIAIRAAMAVDAAKDRRARQALSGRRAAGSAGARGGADVDDMPGDSADTAVVAPLPTVARIVIPTVRGIDLPTVRAPGATPVGTGDFRRLRRATVDTLP